MDNKAGLIEQFLDAFSDVEGRAAQTWGVGKDRVTRYKIQTMLMQLVSAVTQRVLEEVGTATSHPNFLRVNFCARLRSRWRCRATRLRRPVVLQQ